uniref:Uncharacterized protein n=1 Tax=Arundo donax TaxID=35708 RepID=A0A0A8XZR9_ARUDO
MCCQYFSPRNVNMRPHLLHIVASRRKLSPFVYVLCNGVKC